MKLSNLILLLAAARIGVIGQLQPTNETVLTPELINNLAEHARTNNYALLAGMSRVAAAEHNADSIRIWRDPEFEIGGMAAESMMRKEDGDIIYGLEQMLPVFGKEKAQREAARAEVGLEEATLDYEFQTLRKELAEGMFQAALADEILLLTEEDLQWLNTLVASLEERYQAGDATQVDLLRTQNERARRREQLTTARNTREDAYVLVNRMLNWNVHSAWAPLRLPEVGSRVPYNESLVRYARRYEPQVKLLREEINRNNAVARATRKEKRPDLTLGLESRQFSETGEPRSGSVLLKLTLPWFNSGKYESAIRRDEARVRDAENRLEDYHYQVAAEVHHLTARIDAARRDALVYRDEIIPRSEQALASAYSAWQSNRDRFRDLLDARRMLIEARQSYFTAIAEQYMAMSDLVLCCGIGDLEALEMLSKGEEPAERSPEEDSE